MISIVLLVQYFGTFPKYFHHFLNSCANNPTIDWIIYTDCVIPSNYPKNVKFKRTTFADTCKHVSDILGISFSPTNPYKLCDTRPLYPVLYKDDIHGYDFYGYTDIDIIYGNLRKFFTDDFLTQYDVISTRTHLLTGHFSLFRNGIGNEAYINMPHYRTWLQNEDNMYVDEQLFTKVFNNFNHSNTPHMWSYGNDLVDAQATSIHTIQNIRFWMKELYVTPFAPLDKWVQSGYNGHVDVECDVFIWNGDIRDTNGHEYPYVHLMNFEKKRWVGCMFDNRTATINHNLSDKIAWKDNPDVVFCDIGTDTQFFIGWSGITNSTQV